MGDRNAYVSYAHADYKLIRSDILSLAQRYSIQLDKSRLVEGDRFDAEIANNIQKASAFILFLFMSPVCIFLTGCSWPTTAFPAFWKWFSYIFPGTFGVQGYIKINCMGSDFSVIRPEFIALWTQAIFYFITACFSYRYINK